MNKNKKIQIIKSMAKRILLVLKNENCFDGFISRLYTQAKCINYFQECVNKYFKYNDQLINWNKESFTGLSTDEILKKLKKQYGWTVTVVDADHKRNKFKNKNIIWVIFDSSEEASRNMNLFNSMFITAMELDCINEYKKFKQSPDKRPLTFDKLCNTAYDLYDQIDKGLL